MAYVSHLPQLAVSALMHVVGDRVLHEGLVLAGGGLRDTTRLASSPPSTWRDVAATNAPAVDVALDELIGALQRLKDDLAARRRARRGVRARPARWKRASSAMTGMTATRTYLEMTDPAALPSGAARGTGQSGDRACVERPTAALWRYLYTEVGRAHRWVDRLPWTDEQSAGVSGRSRDRVCGSRRVDGETRRLLRAAP